MATYVDIEQIKMYIEMTKADNKNSVRLGESHLRKEMLTLSLADRTFLKDLEAELKETAERIKAGAKETATEATIESYFDRNLYHTLSNIGIEFNPDKEVAQDRIRHVGKGRMDSRIGSIVIEYKRPSLLKTDKQIETAITQLEEYALKLSEDLHSSVRGFLTNGLRMLEIHALAGEIISVGVLEELNGKNLLRITKTLIELESTALTSENLIRDFCGTSCSGILFETARLFDDILETEPSDKTKMLHSEWKELFRLAHDDRSQQKRIEERRKSLSMIFGKSVDKSDVEYRLLFALHTAYAVILKLMAYRVVSDIYLSELSHKYKDLLRADSESLCIACEQLEDGEMFRQLGIINLLEGDFFSWYSAAEQWNENISNKIKSILVILARYEEASRIFETADAIDLFRKLYEQTIPQIVRSSFGEFYTPNWLAEHVLNSVEPSGKWNLLDPCCGSGTFIVVAISRLIRENQDKNSEELLNNIVTRIIAIDLNPLAVLTTRINYFIHIYKYLPSKIEGLIIPVFLGDSTKIPKYIDINGVNCIEYELVTLKEPIKTILPVTIVKDTLHFMSLMQIYEKTIKLQDEETAAKILINSIPEKDINKEVIDTITILTKQLVELEKKHWNGIWARILSNYMTTACLGKFSIIIGNPPWIDWKNLPKNYRRSITSMCIDRGIFSGAGRTGGINLNVCALITHIAINNWLSSDGKLAFLMPRELVNQASYEGWRNLPNNEPRVFLKFYDWTKAGHPFSPVKEDFMTYLIGKKNNDDEYVPVTSYTKKKGKRPDASQWKDWKEANLNLDENNSIAGQVIPNSTIFTFASDFAELNLFKLVAGVCPYIGREGIEFYPQELLLFRFQSMTTDGKNANLRREQRPKSKFKLPVRTVMLETKFLFPMVKAPSIGLFSHNYDGIIVPFPYTTDDTAKPVNRDILRKESELLLRYYDGNRNLIESQNEFSDKIRGSDPGEFYGLARTGPYTFANFHVGFRDNTKWCAAVISTISMPWDEQKLFLFQNHSVSISERPDRSFITEDEAHYICAILNTHIVERFVWASSDNRSFKIRLQLYIPIYNQNNEKHKKLSTLSKLAHTDSTVIDDVRRKAEEIYLALCKQQ